MPSELWGASGEEGPSEGPGTSELGSSVLRIFEAEDRLPGGSCWSGASGAEGSSEGPGTSELGSSALRIFEAELVEAEEVTAAGAEGSSRGPGTSELGSSVLRIFEAELVEAEDVTAADESADSAERLPVTRLRTSNGEGPGPSFEEPFLAGAPDLEAPFEAPFEDLLEDPLELLGGFLVVVAGLSGSSASLGSLETSSASRA